MVLACTRVHLPRRLGSVSTSVSRVPIPEGWQTKLSKRKGLRLMVASAGDRVFPGDTVTLNGRSVDWQRLNTSDNHKEPYIYIKYWKPLGVTCTTDKRVRDNVISKIRIPQRIFPVGRLDKDSTGLLLLTNDGRLVNAILRSSYGHFKKYKVQVNRSLTNSFLSDMRTGVIIRTTAQRDGKKKTITAPTLPCDVVQVQDKIFCITLQEGRNRQIRRMCEALDYSVERLHRDNFAGITLSHLREGEWSYLTGHEMRIVQDAIEDYQC